MASPEYVSPQARRALETSERDIPLEGQESVLGALIGRLPAMIYRCADDAQWTMEFVSAGAEELTGYRPEELVGNARLAYADLVVPWHCESRLPRHPGSRGQAQRLDDLLSHRHCIGRAEMGLGTWGGGAR